MGNMQKTLHYSNKDWMEIVIIIMGVLLSIALGVFYIWARSKWAKERIRFEVWLPSGKVLKTKWKLFEEDEYQIFHDVVMNAGNAKYLAFKGGYIIPDNLVSQCVYKYQIKRSLI